MPSTTSVSVSRPLFSSTVITPSLPTFCLAVGGNGANLCDFGAVFDGTCGRLDFRDDLGHGQIDTTLEVHRVHAGGNRLEAFLDDGLGQHGSGGGAVAGFVIGARGNLFHHLSAHVLELVFQFDFLGDRNTVLGDAGRAERFFDDHVAAFGAQGNLHRVGKDIYATQHAVAGIGVEFDVLSSHDVLL